MTRHQECWNNCYQWENHTSMNAIMPLIYFSVYRKVQKSGLIKIIPLIRTLIIRASILFSPSWIPSRVHRAGQLPWLTATTSFVYWRGKFSSVQSLSHVRLFATPWTAARQASLSITNSRSLLKLMSIESEMPSNHLTLWCGEYNVSIKSITTRI